MTVDRAFAQFQFVLNAADGHELSFLDATRIVGRHLTGTRLRMLLAQAEAGRVSGEDARAAETFFSGGVTIFPSTSIARGESVESRSGLNARTPVRAWAMNHRYPAFSGNIRFAWSVDVGLQEEAQNTFAVAVQIRYFLGSPVLFDGISPDS